MTSSWQHSVWFDRSEIWTVYLPLQRRKRYRSTNWPVSKLLEKQYFMENLILFPFNINDSKPRQNEQVNSSPHIGREPIGRQHWSKSAVSCRTSTKHAPQNTSFFWNKFFSDDHSKTKSCNLLTTVIMQYLINCSTQEPLHYFIYQTVRTQQGKLSRKYRIKEREFKSGLIVK